jgi:hypothetical protein
MVHYSARRALFMRDGSTASVYFSVGDNVMVKTDVWHQPKRLPRFSSKGLVGVVVDVWDKCEVDPHCCCAELAFDAPIEVKFIGKQYDEDSESWTAHFAVDEIERIPALLEPV